MKSKRKKTTTNWMELIKSFGIAIIAALIIRALIIQSYKIPSGSMEDTLIVGDVLFVNKFIYGSIIPFTDWRLPAIREPHPGDIVVFKYDFDYELDKGVLKTVEDNNNYIKRCIAAGGDTVEIRDKEVYVNGKKFQDITHIKFEDPNIRSSGVSDYDPGADYNVFGYDRNLNFNRDNFGPIVVREGHFFMMGDHRDNSIDSRYRLDIPRKNIIGKALIIYWSWDSLLPLRKIFSKVRWSRIGDVIR